MHAGPALEPLLYILVIQRILDRHAYRVIAEREQPRRPSRMRLVHALPSRGGRVCVCLWDAESLESVHNFIHSTFGSIGDCECLEVDEAEALGLERIRVGHPRQREIPMLKPGDILDLGPIGAKFFIKKTAAETEGQSFEMEWELAPESGGTPIHVHPRAAETYEVLEGKLDVYVEGVWRTLSAGEKLRVERGAPHTFRNSTDDVVRVYNSHEPAMRFDEYFEGLERLAIRGIISAQRITPKAILHLAMLMTSHEEEIISVKPPHLLMRILGRIGRLLGYRI